MGKTTGLSPEKRGRSLSRCQPVSGLNAQTPSGLPKVGNLLLFCKSSAHNSVALNDGVADGALKKPHPPLIDRCGGSMGSPFPVELQALEPSLRALTGDHCKAFGV
jgi:hypothetical protein